MELEAPADAWYVWLGVATISVAVAGVAVSLPSEPPPDANAAANAIDRSAGSVYNASTEYDHDAEEFRVDTKRIALRNDGGTARASIAYGNMTLARLDDSLLAVLHGASVTDEFASRDAFLNRVDGAHATMESNPTWRVANGRLQVRTITFEDRYVTLVDA